MEQFGRINLSPQQLEGLKTPCYIVNESKLEDNLKVLKYVQDKSGAKILLAFKGFAMWHMAKLIRKYLPGTSASSLNEALLGHQEFGGELHCYAPAYDPKDMEQLLLMSDHLVFNSISQWNRYKAQLKPHPHVQAGLRINPEHSETDTAIYDPSGPYSRLGTTLQNFKEGLADLEGISGLHFHNLCELNADALERTLEVVEEKFAFYFDRLSWINFGGGHHITRADYDLERLISIIRTFQEKYQLQVYLEPGEAIALNAGVLVSSVLDVFHNGMDLAILDTSATAHMPDVLEMPYRPEIAHAGKANEKAYTFRLGGVSCLAGDVIGDYSFDRPLQVGDKLIFGDMAHYTMVKNTTFNGVRLPYIYKFNSQDKALTLLKAFSYQDYKSRLS